MKRGCGIAAAVLLAWGCAPGVVRTPVFRHPEFTVPCEVAVLPVINRTRDARAAAVVRELMCDVLVSRGYRVLPVDWVDARLADAGYTDTELALLAPREDLAGALTTTVFVVGALQSGERTPVGLFEKRTVRLSAEIMHGATTYWRGALEATRYGMRTADVAAVSAGQASRSRRAPVRRVRRASGAGESDRHPLRDDLATVVSALLAEVPGETGREISW